MLALILLFLGVGSRLMVHAPNFTPVLALALFGGVYLPRRYAVAVPVVLMVLSDCALGFYDMMFFTWAGVLLAAAIGLLLRPRRQPAAMMGGALAASVVFFVVSNLGAWPTLYPLTMEGLRQCFIAAVPFFRNTLLSTVVYTLILVGLYEVIAAQLRKTAAARVWLAS